MKTLIIIMLTLGVVLLPFKNKFNSVEKCMHILCTAFNILSSKRLYFHLCVFQLILAVLAGFTVYKIDAMTLGDLAYDNQSSIDRFFLLNDGVFLYGAIIAWFFVCALSGFIVWSNFRVKEKRRSTILRFILQLISVPLTFILTVFYFERDWLMIFL